MELILIEKKREALDVVTFYFKSKPLISWTAGQYLIYSLDHQNQDVRGKMRFFTIASTPPEGKIAITTRIDKNHPSTFKKTLNEMKIGQKISAKGPDGNFVIEDPLEEYIFIAGGIGITPFRAILTQLTYEKSPAKINLLYSYSNEDIPFKKEFEQITRDNPNIKVNYFISPSQIDANTIRKYVRNPKTPLYYISGPNTFVEELTLVVKSLGVEDKRIKHDFFHGYETI